MSITTSVNILGRSKKWVAESIVTGDTVLKADGRFVKGMRFYATADNGERLLHNVVGYASARIAPPLTQDLGNHNSICVLIVQMNPPSLRMHDFIKLLQNIGDPRRM